MTGVSPASGPTAGNTTVIINGSNLAGATAVDFGNRAATITSETASQITAISPAGMAGTVDVTVVTANGTSALTSADQFTYVAAAPALSSLPDIQQARNANGELELFAIGSDHAVYTTSQTSPNGPWSNWTALGGSSWVSSMQVAANANGTLEVFGISTGNVVYTITQSAPNGSWGSWTPLGGTSWVSSMEVAANANGALEVFGISSGNVVYTITQSAPSGSWGSWTALGGTSWVSSMQVAANANGALEVFGISSGNVVYTITQSAPNGSWGSWTALGGTSWVSSMEVAANANGALEVFGISSGNVAYTITQSAPSGSWGSWTLWVVRVGSARWKWLPTPMAPWKSLALAAGMWRTPSRNRHPVAVGEAGRPWAVRAG